MTACSPERGTGGSNSPTCYGPSAFQAATVTRTASAPKESDLGRSSTKCERSHAKQRRSPGPHLPQGSRGMGEARTPQPVTAHRFSKPRQSLDWFHSKMAGEERLELSLAGVGGLPAPCAPPVRSSFSKKCSRGESNPHVLRHQALNLTRLPKLRHDCRKCVSPDSNRETAGSGPTRSTKIPFTHARWWPRQDFNLRPSDFQSDALAAELHGHESGRPANRTLLAEATGLQPASGPSLRVSQRCARSDLNRYGFYSGCV